MSYKFRRLDDGEVVEVDWTWEELHDRMDVLRRVLLPDGAEAELCVEGSGSQRSRDTAKVPFSKGLESESMSVYTAEEAAIYNAAAESRGIKGVHWDSTGKCHLESRKARNATLKMLRYRDKSAGYGDYAG